MIAEPLRGSISDETVSTSDASVNSEDMLIEIDDFDISPITRISPSLLNSVFATSGRLFPHLPAPDTQCEQKCREYYQLLTTVGKRLREKTDLSQFLPQTVAESKSTDRIEFFPGYGCAMVFAPSTFLFQRNVSKVRIVALDGWVASHQSTASFVECHSISTKSYIIDCHEITDDVDDCLAELKRKLQEARSRSSGDKRSAAFNDQGHQRTPAFIHALWQDVLNGVDQGALPNSSAKHQPSGGLTDVGLHTGGRARDTSWSLSLAVFKETHALKSILNDEHLQQQYWDIFRCLFELELLELFYESVKVANSSNQADSTLSKYVSNDEVNMVLVMLDSIARRSSQWAHNLTMKDWQNITINQKEIMSRCKDIKCSLQELVAINVQLYANQFLLKVRPDYCSLLFPLKFKEVSDGTRSLCASAEDVLATANRNLGNITILRDLEFPSVREWLSLSCSVDTSWTIPLKLETVERLVLETMKKVTKKDVVTICLKDVEDILLTYRNLLQVYLKTVRNSEFSATPNVSELRSKEVLVKWASYCISHYMVETDCKLLSNYGVSLDPSDLRHLLLKDSDGLTLLKLVSQYLRERMEKPSLFSLRRNDETFDFAYKYAVKRSKLVAISEDYRRRTESRIETRWSKILEQQAKVDSLKGQIEELFTKYPILRESTEHFRRSATHEEKMSKNKWDTLHSQLQTALEAPPPLINCLPKYRIGQLGCLFFLYMPREFQILSSLSFVCQQATLPEFTPDEIQDLREVCSITAKFDIHNHFKKYVEDILAITTTRKPAVQTPVYLLSNDKLDIPSLDGSFPTIEHFHTRNDGVWYPSSKLHMGWCGGNCPLDKLLGSDPFDPFKAAEHFQTQSVEYFTEKLPKHHHALQWCMYQCGEQVSADRGNQGYARQDNKPEWCSQEQYLNMVNIRAYSHTQLRLLIDKMSVEKLALSHHVVHTIVKQALYHVGPLNKDFFPEWRIDERDQDQQFAVLFKKIESILDEIHAKPREHSVFYLLAQLAAFLSQFQVPSLTKRIAETAIEWAKLVSYSVSDSTTSTDTISDMKCKEAIFFSYGCIALSLGDRELQSAELSLLLQLLVLIQHNSIYEGTIDKNRSFLREITMLCKNCVARKFTTGNLLIRIQEDMLTDAVMPIINSFLTAGVTSLRWNIHQLHGDLSPCFHCYTDDKDLISINVLTGVVLLNGYPPARLPQDILSHPLYTRIFGDSNFETLITSDKWLQTVRPVADHLYRFSMPNNSLVVEEISKGKATVLRLLTSPDCNSWCVKLPLRLQKLYSHWYSSEHDVILFRPIEKGITPFLSKVPEFIATNAFSNNEASLFGLPFHLRKRFIDSSLWHDYTFAEELDELVCADDFESRHLTKIFEKFEDERFIHYFLMPSGFLKVVLPRYELEFEQQRIVGQDIFASLDFSGYKLSASQQYSDVLLGFERYLVLDNGDLEIVLIPKVTFRSRNNAAGRLIQLDTVVSDDPANQLKYYYYEVHPRFRTLKGKCIEANMQLAAIYTAYGTYLPEPRLERSGYDEAMTILRECWSNKPFTLEEFEHLRAVVVNSSSKCPSLSLLCCYAFEWSKALQFLFPQSFSISCELLTLDNLLLLKSAYSSNSCSCSLRLSGAEERFLFGRHVHFGTSAVAYSLSPYQPIEINLEVGDIKEFIITSIDNLRTNFEEASAEVISLPKKDFPLNQTSMRQCKVGEDYTKQLLNSWNIYYELVVDASNVTFSTARSIDRVGALLEDTTMMIKSVEDNIKSCLQYPNSGDIVDTYASLRYEQYSLKFCSFTRRDMLRVLTTNQQAVLEFNPLLSKNAVENIYKLILMWGKLCVAQDKLKRLLSYTRSKSDESFTQEILNERHWKPRDHPGWLAFEIEQRLEIRMRQYRLADHLMNNPGAIVQLNMGEGKTRVVLPMLLIAFRQSRSRISRIHFLQNLVGEAYEYLHNTLTSSALLVPLCMVPFHRDVQIGTEEAKLLNNVFRSCAEMGMIIITTPEARMSLLLKRHDIDDNGESKERNVISEELDAIEKFSFNDIFDESDVALGHRLKLVYTVGVKAPLLDLESRVEAVESLLWAIKDNNNVRDILQLRKIADTNYDVLPDRFPYLQLIAGHELNAHLDQLIKALAIAVFDKLPYNFRGVGKYIHQRDSLISYVVNPEYELSLHFITEEREKQFVWALRGLLAFGILPYCLQRRNQVHFGVVRPHPMMKLIAVPFRANNFPAERAEFTSIDVTVCFTYMAYLYDGLSAEQVYRAFETLLQLNPNAQREQYNQMYEISLSAIDVADRDALDCVNKIDLTNAWQLQLLHKYFRLNFFTVSFWLKQCMLPEVMVQFPYEIMKSPWNICDGRNSRAVGFSGVKDTAMLLPLHVKHQDIPDKDLQATDAKMLHLLLRCEGYTSIATSNVDLWKDVLKDCISKNVCALIDLGALLAGTTPRSASKFLFKSSGFNFDAIVFHDVTRKEWRVLHRSGREWPKHSSPTHERDAFVIYDESQCRGADMKLKANAKAVLTLQMNVTKDKLMQAAGRLRQLDKGQNLYLLGTEDVTNSIKNIANSASQPTSKNVIEWAVGNTISAIWDGLLEWTVQGCHYCGGESRPHDIRIPSKHLLSELYQAPQVGQTFVELFNARAAEVLENYGVHCVHCVGNVSSVQLPGAAGNHLKELLRCADNFADSLMSTSTLDAECEKELEMENEKEKEVEKQISRAEPHVENDWDLSLLYHVSGFKNGLENMSVFCAAAGVKHFSDIFVNSSINWGAGEVLSTDNFRNTIKSGEISSISFYTRTVTFALLVRDSSGSVSALLLSEREANRILQDMSFLRKRTITFFLTEVNHLDARCISASLLPVAPRIFPVDGTFEDYQLVKGSNKVESKTFIQSPANTWNSLLSQINPFNIRMSPRFHNVQAIVDVLNIFRGNTSFVENHILHEILVSKQAKDEAIAILKARGKCRYYERSDLEKFEPPNRLRRRVKVKTENLETI